MIEDTQIPERYRSVIDEQISIYNEGTTVQVRKEIPDTTEIPIQNPRHWLRIPDVVCVFVDMKGSTQLSATTHDRSTAGAFQLYSGTAVKLFAAFQAPYIDLKGDGVFALFDSSQVYRALASAITFKTFAKEEFAERVKKKTGVEVGSRVGIDRHTILVRKIGFKRYRGRSDRQNEVWAGKTVNMASKLASLASDHELRVSDRFFEHVTHNAATHSCGCPDGEKVALWKEVDLSEDDRFDFDTSFSLTTQWCAEHGAEYCETLLKQDDE